MSKFFGRVDELKILNELLKKKTSSLIVLRGRRRIGKSRLIEEFGSKHRFISLSGLPPTPLTTAQNQRDEFMKQLSRKYGVPKMNHDDWGDIFWMLGNMFQSDPVIILFDEISWMGSKDHNFLGKLKIAWDQYFSKNPRLILILCGSVSSWIEENILSSTSFFGRISLDLILRELPLHECRQFWSNRVSSYEIFKTLAITGGIPKYLEEIIPKETAENNIRRLCFTPEGLLFREFNQIFTDLYGDKASHYEEIVKTLSEGPLDLDSICKQLSIEKGGNISKQLRNLELSGFIQIDPTWDIKQNVTSRLKRYRLSDNYLRFYLKYLHPRFDQIKEGIARKQLIEMLPGWSSVLGLQFQNLVLANKSSVFSSLNIDPSTVVHSGSFFQQKTKQRKGCQIDLLIQTRYRTIYICEIKFSENPVGASIIEEFHEKIQRLSIPRLYSIRTVLIHVNGVTDAVRDSATIDHLIDFQSIMER